MFNYKKLIKKRSTRLKFLHLFDFIPDKLMLYLQYFVKTGRKLNLKNPQRFTEKLQWYKLYYKNSLMKQCVDKYDVRRYVEKLGLKEILNECYGVFDKVEDIDFSKLPNSFVLKDTLGSGGNDVIIVKDKTKLNINETTKRMNEWINYPFKGKHPGREWPYENKKHRIIIEKFIETNKKEGLIDYKLFCFKGKPYYLYIISNRVFGKKAELGIYDINFNKLNYVRADELFSNSVYNKPQNYEQMLYISQILSQEFPEVRIDLFNVEGKIYFGEMTFFDGSGYMTFKPDEFDYILGKEFIIN